MAFLRELLALVGIIAAASFSLPAQRRTEDHRPPAWAIPDRPVDAPLSVLDFNDIHVALNQSGKVRVIVRVRQPRPVSRTIMAEGISSNAEIADELKSTLGRQQDGILRRLSADASANARKYEFIPFIAMDVDSSDYYRLLNDPDIDLIERDIVVPPALTQSVPLIGGDGGGTFAGYTGLGSTVAVLDTGVDKTHPFLYGKVVAEACYSTSVSGMSQSLCPDGQNSQVGVGAGVSCPGSVASCGHGTHVAGIAAGNGGGFSGVAKDASIISIQVFSRFNSTSSCDSGAPCALSWTSDQISGLQQVYALRGTYSIAAVNMSIGGGKYTGYCDSSNVSLKAAIDNLRAVGIATIIASGNLSSSTGISSPGCISSAISVGATTKSDTVPSYSNSSSILNLLAPGSSIYSSVPDGAYASWTGTSMATPHVTGAWAVIKSKKPTATVDEILNALKSTGVRVTDSRNRRVFRRIKIDTSLSQIAMPSPTILCRHSDGRLASWSMEGPVFGSGAYLANGASISNAWKVAGIGDFNSDGKQDILWQSSDGLVGVWLMNSTNTLGYAMLNGGNSIDTSWSIIGVADFDRNGKPDLLWRSSTGLIALWYMNGTSLVGTAVLNDGNPVPLSWRLVGAVDFNMDSNPDLFWHSSTGQIAVWYLNGASLTGTALLNGGIPIDTAWTVVAVADFTGDGNTDILWQHTDGTLAVWALNGITLGSVSTLYGGNSPGAVWSAIGAFRP